MSAAAIAAGAVAITVATAERRRRSGIYGCSDECDICGHPKAVHRRWWWAWLTHRAYCRSGRCRCPGYEPPS